MGRNELLRHFVSVIQEIEYYEQQKQFSEIQARE